MTDKKLDFGQLMAMDVASLGLLYCRYTRDVFGFIPDPKSIATTKEGLIRQFHQAEEAIERDERFNEVIKIMLANLVTDVKYLAREAAHCKDVSDFGGTVGSLLAGARLSGKDIREFADEFERRFKLGEHSPAIDKIRQENNETIKAVVDAAIAMASRLNIEVTDKSADELINIVLERSSDKVVRVVSANRADAVKMLYATNKTQAIEASKHKP